MMLVLVTLGWGISYYFMDISMAEMGPFTLNAYRFFGAFIVAALLTFRKVIHVNKETLIGSLMIGTALVIVYTCVTFGVEYTTLNNSAFLCSTTVIATPVLELFILRKKPTLKIIVCVLLCMGGIMMLTLTNGFAFNRVNLKGDILCLICGIFYSVEIILTDRFVKNEKVDPYQMGVYGLGVTGIWMIILSLIFESPSLPSTPAVWGAVIFLSLFCTGIAFIVQPIAQQYTEASHVGIIYALEPVFAGIVAFALAHEILTMRGYMGEVLMVASLFIMEINFKSTKKHRQGADADKVSDEDEIDEFIEEVEKLPRT